MDLRCPRCGFYRDTPNHELGCKPDDPVATLTAPRADYQSAWTELTGYVQQARDDGDQIDPDDLLRFMAELKHRALAPIREWVQSWGK
jgi:hypothetical protein